MSVRYITRAIDETSVTGNDRLVLIALADHADDEGRCFPGQEHLAKRTGLGQRTIVRVVARLEEAGLIQLTRRYRVDGPRTSNEYQLFPELSATLTTGDLVPKEADLVPAVALRGESSVRTPRGKKKGETELPDDWAPTEDHKERARKQGLDIGEQVELFRLHAQTHGRVAKVWNAAFTTWLIKAPLPRGVPGNVPARTLGRWQPPQEKPRPVYDPRDPNSPKPYAGEN